MCKEALTVKPDSVDKDLTRNTPIAETPTPRVAVNTDRGTRKMGAIASRKIKKDANAVAEKAEARESKAVPKARVSSGVTPTIKEDK